MSGIALSEFITDWDSVTTGDGVYVVSSQKLLATCAAGQGTGRSFAVKYLPVSGGEFITFTFTARATSGKGIGSIDYRSSSRSPEDQIEINSKSWREYSISIAVPYDHNNQTHYVSVICGVMNEDAGIVEIADLRINVKDGSRNPLNCVASALINVSRIGGSITPAINPNFHYCGIKALALSGSVLTVTIPTSPSLVNSNMRPIFFAQLTTENLLGWQLKVGEYNQATGTVDIVFVNPSGAAADPNTGLATNAGMFISFMAVGI